MTKQEYLNQLKDFNRQVERIEDFIKILNNSYMLSELKKLGLKEGDIVEVEVKQFRFGEPDKKVWVRGYLNRITVEDDGTLQCHLGRLKKDNTPSAQGTVRYFVHLTGKWAQPIRKVKV